MIRGPVIRAALLLVSLVVPTLATSVALSLAKGGPAGPVASVRVKPRAPVTTGDASAAYDSAYDDNERPEAVSHIPTSLSPVESYGSAMSDRSMPLVGMLVDRHHMRFIRSDGSRAPPAACCSGAGLQLAVVPSSRSLLRPCCSQALVPLRLPGRTSACGAARGGRASRCSPADPETCVSRDAGVEPRDV